MLCNYAGGTSTKHIDIYVNLQPTSLLCQQDKHSNGIILEEKLPVLFGEHRSYKGTCFTKQEHLSD